MNTDADKHENIHGEYYLLPTMIGQVVFYHFYTSCIFVVSSVCILFKLLVPHRLKRIRAGIDVNPDSQWSTS